MDWFGKRARERLLEKRLAEMEARVASAGLMSFALLTGMERVQRAETLAAFKGFVAKSIGQSAPQMIPQEYHQDFRNELSRALQIVLQISERADNGDFPEPN